MLFRSRFHGADGGGRCFPSHEKIAPAARFHRDSVCVAIAALEDTGLLTWVHWLVKVRRRERDLFDHWGSNGRSIPSGQPRAAVGAAECSARK